MNFNNPKIYFTVLALLPACVSAQSKNRNALANMVVATMNTGINPSSIAINPNNNTGYVTNANELGFSLQDTISVLNLQNNTVMQTISDPSFNEPSSITFNPNGTKAYVTNSNGTTLSVLNPVTNQVTGTISGFDGPAGLAISSNGQTGYAINYGSAGGVGVGNGTTVSVINLNNNTITKTITVGQGPSSVALSPNGNSLLVTSFMNGDMNTGTLSVINTATNMVTNTITGFSGPTGVAISPNGSRAFVTNFGSGAPASPNSLVGNTVSVVNLYTGQIIKTINVGLEPSAIAITPNGNFAYVTNSNTFETPVNSSVNDVLAGQGTVSIINTNSNMVVAPTIEVGQDPSAITISANGKLAYVTNALSNTVSVIQLPNPKSPCK
jgi:YVTN family beta-propeller protein